MYVWAAQDDNDTFKFGLYDAAGNPRRSIAAWSAFPDKREVGGVASALLAARSCPIVLDNFARANSATLVGTSPLGGTPTAAMGVWGVTGKTAGVITDGGTSHNALVWETNTADLTLATEAVISNVNFNVGIVFRYVDTSNYWVLQFTRETGPMIKVYKNVAGTFTQVGTTIAAESAGILTTGSGLVSLKLVLRGDRIFGYERDRLVFSATDAAHANNTKHGIYTYASGDTVRAKFYKFAAKVPLRAY